METGTRAAEVRKVVQRVAAVQHGVVARWQLLEAGIQDSGIDKRLGGLLFPVFPGVYAVGRPQITQKGLWMAGVLCGGRGAVLGYRSAAAHWGILRALPTVEVIRGRSRRSLRVRVDVEGVESFVPLWVRRTRNLPEQDVQTKDGISLTSVARTLLNLASTLDHTGLEKAFLEADRLGLLEDEQLIECATRSNGHRGAARFRLMILRRIPPGRHLRSVLESIFLAACRDGGIELPETNVLIGPYEVDCVWRKPRVIVELDGYEYHRGLEMFERDAGRGNQLRSDGWAVLRFTWRMLANEPDLVLNQVRNALKNQAVRDSTTVPNGVETITARSGR